MTKPVGDAVTTDEFQRPVAMTTVPLFVVFEITVDDTLLELEVAIFGNAILEVIRIGVVEICEDVVLVKRSDDRPVELEFGKVVAEGVEELAIDVVLDAGINSGNSLAVVVEVVGVVEILADEDICEELISVIVVERLEAALDGADQEVTANAGVALDGGTIKEVGLEAVEEGTVDEQTQDGNAGGGGGGETRDVDSSGMPLLCPDQVLSN